MSIIKPKLKENFLIASNEIFKYDLTGNSIKLYFYLCSKPSTWNIYNKKIMDELKISEKTLTKCWKQLLRYKLISRKPRKVNNKFSGGFDYFITAHNSASLSNSKDVQNGNSVAFDQNQRGNKEEGTCSTNALALCSNCSCSKGTCSCSIQEGMLKEKESLKNILKEKIKKNKKEKVQPTDVGATKVAFTGKKMEENFNFDGFTNEEREAIERWFVYRREIKKPYKSTLGLNALRNNLMHIKQTCSIIDAINNSIAHEYQGVFEIKAKNFTSLPAKKANTTEIGRASCRERV